ncbi:carbohydrate ABC transporter permease [Paenibacillus humicola]|uniref:carbohydrate ABC transporter permease n=1 Tax=Paenibacillus humicola TaxID=3110540 RepID=UPI00237C256A|nr:carbohydrate ABC transporter permease [Paenibacillus humicola]
MIKNTPGEKIFIAVNYVFMIFVMMMMLYPFWYLFMYSISDPKLSATGGLFLKPSGFSLASYSLVFNNVSFLSGFRVSFIVTIAGTLMAVFFTATTAYAISKKRLRGGTFFTFIFLFTMLFNGGIVPSYLLVKDLHLLDSLWALILPNMLGAWNILVMRTFFAGIPEELEEAAKIDGASTLRIFFSIILPLSKAVLATIGLFVAVFYWNDFFSTILYITDKNKWALQAVLRDIVNNASSAMQSQGVSIGYQQTVSENTVKMASIVVATLPILIVYPFIQKYFAKGAMIGSVKG